ncbi:MAG: HK97 family phage prohead protease [Deltaproteobacteria bacterium]|nr:HK97 family phage prohead protease [Deltaproteobacteria bacterium]
MELIRKALDFHIRQVGTPSDRILEFIGSTADVDRYGDIIEVDGWDLENYQKNPVFLWAHDYKQPPIGKAVKVEKTDKGLLFHIKFAAPDEYPFADTIYKLYLGGYLRATSVGFRDLEREPLTDEDGKQTGWRYTKQELYELSAVPVPANPNALIMAVQKGVVTAHEVEEMMGVPFEKDLVLRPYANEHACRLQDPEKYESFRRKNCAAKVDGKCVDHIYGIKDGKTELQSLRYRLEEGWTEEEARMNCEKHGGMFEPAIIEEKGVIPYKEYPTEPEDAPWDGPKEIRQAEVEDLRVICAWYDSENPDIKASYKLPHHRAKGYRVVWKGVSAAMAALLGARGGVKIPEDDKKGVYNHLAKHYLQFEKEPPEFREYGCVDLRLIELGFPPLGHIFDSLPEYVREALDALCELILELEEKLMQAKSQNQAAEAENLSKAVLSALHDFFKAGDGPVVKAGAVLSAKNKAALKQAQALIQQVLDSAESKPEGEEGKEQPHDIYSLALNPGIKPQRGKPAEEPDLKHLLSSAQKIHQMVKGGK